MLDPDRSLPGMINTQCGLHPRVHEAPSRSKHARRSFPDCRILKRATSGHSTRRNKRAAARSQRSREGQGSLANKSQSWWNGMTRCRYAVPCQPLVCVLLTRTGTPVHFNKIVQGNPQRPTGKVANSMSEQPLTSRGPCNSPHRP